MDRIEELAKKFIQDAELVECPIADFYRGLQAAKSLIEERLELASCDGVELE